SPVDAVIERLVADEGYVAEVGEVIAILGEAGAAVALPPPAVSTPTPTSAAPPAGLAPAAVTAPPSPAPATTPAPAPAASAAAPRDPLTGKVLATPAARALAREQGIDLQQVPGREGRITKADVLHAQQAAPAPAPVAAAAATAAAVPAPVAPPPPAAATPAVAAPRRDLGAIPADETIPFRGMRRRIAEGMVKAYSTAVHYTYVEQIDVTALVKVRDQARAAAKEQGVKLSYLPFIVKAVLLGLKKFPIVNAVLDEEAAQIILKKRYSIGVATATDQGLMVPVVHDADRLSLLDIGREIARISEAARTGKASREELTGSTFTITSLGNIGGVLATPILNYPEVGVLGVHAIRKTPIVDANDQIVVGHIMNLSVSLDHRVVDGFEGASFLQEVKRYLEDPTLLLLAGI
ncbi:MAG: dihydrolipoamide acetyltransferase family protein, partial [Nannocystaceae bacterium]